MSNAKPVPEWAIVATQSLGLPSCPAIDVAAALAAAYARGREDAASECGEALRAETRRRQWARIHGCYVGWGIINSAAYAHGEKAILGVIATDENFNGPYRRHTESEAYIPQPTNLGAVSPEEAERAECAAIDKMIEAVERDATIQAGS